MWASWSNRRITARCWPSSLRTARCFRSRRVSRSRERRFRTRASYDGAVSNWLTARGPDGVAAAFPDRFNLQAVKVQDLRYGENPHQQAAFYRDEKPAPGTIATYRQLQGKELSFNNLADADAAWECVKSLASVRRRGMRDRQACESLRRGDCGEPARGLSQCVRDRSRFGLRRHHRLRPAGRRGDARGGVGAISRSADRAGLHGGCDQRDRAEKERARAGGRFAGGRAAAAARSEADRRRLPPAERRCARHRAARSSRS